MECGHLTSCNQGHGIGMKFVFDHFQQLVVKLISRLREGSLHIIFFVVVLVYQTPSVSPLLHCRTSSKTNPFFCRWNGVIAATICLFVCFPLSLFPQAV